MNSNYITSQGLAYLKAQLKNLEEELSNIINDLTAAREQGDLSENFDYHENKKKLNTQNYAINELRSHIANSNVIIPTHNEYIQIGSYVRADSGGVVQIFMITGDNDISTHEGDIRCLSYRTPIGKALMNKEKDAEIEVVTPAGIRNYKILQIEIDPKHL